MKRGLLLAAVIMHFMLTVGCAFWGHPEPIDVIGSYADPATNETVKPQPVSGRFGQFFMQRHEQIQQSIHNQDQIGVLLVGDSITHFWEAWQPELYKQYFGDYRPINFGIAGDQTQHVLWRLENTDFEGKQPKAATVLIGTNNLGGGRFTPEQVADGVIEVCRTLRADFPTMKILLLGIFPRADAGNSPALQAQLDAVNALIEPIGDECWIYYRDYTEKFLLPDGSFNRPLFPDGIHPGPEGYRAWGEAMKADLEMLMGK